MTRMNESDWKPFRSRFPDWQERHMAPLIPGYAVLPAPLQDGVIITLDDLREQFAFVMDNSH